MATKQRQSKDSKRLSMAVNRVLKEPIPQEKESLRKLLQENDMETTNDNGIALAMVMKALTGDKQAADWVRDTSGGKPKDEVKVGGEAVVIISGEDKIAE